MTTDQTIEAEIQTKGKTAARITPADVENEIAFENSFTAQQGVYGAAAFLTDGCESVENVDYDAPAALNLLTICVLTLRNGFTVTGESACASPENFDAEIGRKIARANAVQKVWPLMGYQLRTALAGTAPPVSNAFVAPGCEPFSTPATVNQFRKKPVVIEAFQMTRERRSDNSDWPEWLNAAWNGSWPAVGAVSCEDFPNSDGTDRLMISTLEGAMTVSWDDWIIRGVKGELYACKPDIFAATYDQA